MAAYSADSEWHHWVFRYDGGAGEYEIFKDGVSVYSQTGITGTIGASAGMLEFGAVNTWGIDASMDDIQVWDSALTDAEVVTLATCKVPV
jgi:hypothetical protein